MYPCLILLLFFIKTVCKDKYTHSTNSQTGEFSFDNNPQTNDVVLTKRLQLYNFNKVPNVLLGISQLYRNKFNYQDNVIHIQVIENNIDNALVQWSISSENKNSFQSMKLKYLAFSSNEAQILNIIVNDEDIKNMVKNESSFLRSLKKTYNYQLQKKANAKRSVSCFIIAFRQIFSSIPTDQTDYILSFFVEASGELNENQFELKFATLDQSNSIQYIKLNCIEFYEYEKNFEPQEFIQIIHENKYDYSQIQSLDKYLTGECFIQNVKSQAQDISFNNNQIFYGFNGIDYKVQQSVINLDYSENSETKYYFQGPIRAIRSSFLLFKMRNCPFNCEECSDNKTCQECELKFTLNSNGQCIPCKDKCLSCDINLNCLACEQPSFLYKTQCYMSQPKRTYCISRPFYQL